MKGKPYYKFNQPCTHRMYSINDSLTEELSFSRHQLESARKKIATEIKTGESYLLSEQNLILYWHTYNNLTFYYPNFIKMLEISTINTVLESHFPAFAKWKLAFLKLNIPPSEVRFSASTKADMWQSHIQKTTTVNYSKDKTEEKVKLIKNKFDKNLSLNSLKKIYGDNA